MIVTRYLMCKRVLCVCYVSVCVCCESRADALPVIYSCVPVRSLVHLSNVSPVLVDYPRYLHHQGSETPLISLSCCLHCVQLPTKTSDNTWGTSKNKSGEEIWRFYLIFCARWAQLCIYLLQHQGWHRVFHSQCFCFWHLCCLRVSGSVAPGAARHVVCRRWRKMQSKGWW